MPRSLCEGIFAPKPRGLTNWGHLSLESGNVNARVHFAKQAIPNEV